MDDTAILDLFFRRDESAISETDLKYGRYCRRIAQNILNSEPDSEECVSDTYFRVWNVIPPQRPQNFSAFLGKITRNLSISRLRKNNAVKRGCGEYELCLDELRPALSPSGNPELEYELRELTGYIDLFLAGLCEAERNIFVSRYWFLLPVAQIAECAGFTPSKTTSMLFRTRNKLRKYLIKEGLL